LPGNVNLKCLEGVGEGLVKNIPNLFPKNKHEVAIVLNAPFDEGKYVSTWKCEFID